MFFQTSQIEMEANFFFNYYFNVSHNLYYEYNIKTINYLISLLLFNLYAYHILNIVLMNKY